MKSSQSLFKDKYKKVKKMPGGAYGKIYCCEDVDDILKKTIVIKKFKFLDVPFYIIYLKPKVGMDIDTVREVRFLNILSHPNIINVLKFQ